MTIAVTADISSYLHPKKFHSSITFLWKKATPGEDEILAAFRNDIAF